MTDTVLAKLAALKAAPMPALKEQWRQLFDKEPSPYNRSFLESRLAYRSQELADGGLKPETIAGWRRSGRSSTAATSSRDARGWTLGPSPEPG